MPKGDGWAVKRYMCPVCWRKGLYLNETYGSFSSSFRCMYLNCESHSIKTFSYRDILAANPELNFEKAKWKP